MIRRDPEVDDKQWFQILIESGDDDDESLLVFPAKAVDGRMVQAQTLAPRTFNKRKKPKKPKHSFENPTKKSILIKNFSKDRALIHFIRSERGINH